jgi:hypothetical protein
VGVAADCADRERSVDLPAGATGLRLDVGATVDRVLDESPSDWLLGLLDRTGPSDVTPVVRVRESTLESAVRQLVSAAYVAPSAADLRYVDGEISLSPAVPGQAVPPQAVETALRAAAADLSDRNGVVLPVTQGPAPPVDDAAAEAVAAKARTVLDRGVVLRADGRSRALRAAELGTTADGRDGCRRCGPRPACLGGHGAGAGGPGAEYSPDRSADHRTRTCATAGGHGDGALEPKAGVRGDDPTPVGRPARSPLRPSSRRCRRRWPTRIRRWTSGCRPCRCPDPVRDHQRSWTPCSGRSPPASTAASRG